MSRKPGENLRLSRALYERMREDVSCRAPEEACGIIAGKSRQAKKVYVITNALHSPTAFRMEAQEQIDAFLEIEKEDKEILAIYHSHPTGPETPSETDIAEFAYPGVFMLIWYKHDAGWDCRNFIIDKMRVIEAGIKIDSK